ncbi:MAG TPA: MFS transporter [Candidatus Polarisedimenticolia bacterium]|nr:MFS transporter [Candidatus Polarisedimenticolia bacterium]
MPDDPRPLLRRPEFRFLLGARLTYAVAASALATVVAFQTYDLTHDPLSLGWLGLAEGIPALALALFGGHVADRRDRRSIVLLSGITVTICAALLGLLALTGAFGLLGILVVIAITGIASGFERPALSAFEAQIIPRAEAVRGASYASSVSQAGVIGGPAIGGLAVAIIGMPETYAAITVLLVASTICVAFIARKPMPARSDDGESMIQSVLAGVRFVRRSPVLLGSMSLDLFAVFFGGAIALLPIFATDILHVGPAGLGLLRTAPSIGALAVMLVATRRPPSRSAGPMLLVCVAGFGVSMLVFGLSTTFWLSMVALFFSGVTDGVSMIIRSAIGRIFTPDSLRGRVSSVNWVFIGASNELGAFESGFVARLIGAVPSVIAGALVTLGVVGLVAAAVPELRRLNLDRASPVEAEAGA